MTTTTFEIEQVLTPEEQAEQASALAQGEEIAKALEEDRRLSLERLQREEQPVELIGGKFKSQDELLRAYKELETKLGKGIQTEEEEASEKPGEATEDDPDAEGGEDQESEPLSEEESKSVDETVALFNQYQEQWAQTGDLSDEAIEKLASIEPKVLVQSYIKYMAKQRATMVQASEIAKIKGIAGGDQAYADMVGWAAKNLPAEDVEAFNEVTKSGHVASIRFAVEALKAKYEEAEGKEPRMLRGRTSRVSQVKPYRSNAELARDIEDPRYSKDPAFRNDVMARLAVSADLL